MKFFVIIRHQKGHPMPLLDALEDIMLFDTRKEAEAAAKRNMMGEAYGFAVYEWDS